VVSIGGIGGLVKLHFNNELKQRKFSTGGEREINFPLVLYENWGNYGYLSIKFES